MDKKYRVHVEQFVIMNEELNNLIGSFSSREFSRADVIIMFINHTTVACQATGMTKLVFLKAMGDCWDDNKRILENEPR